MKRIKTLLTIALTLALTFMMSVSAFAYNPDDYKVLDEDDSYLVDDKARPGNISVYFYTLIPDEYCSNSMSFGDRYHFYQEPSDATPYGVNLFYDFNVSNWQYKIAHLDGIGDVFRWQFTIEPGTYDFSHLESSGSHLYSMNQNFSFDYYLDENGEKQKQPNFVTYEENLVVVDEHSNDIRPLSTFAIYGTSDDWWNVEIQDAFIAFAKEKAELPVEGEAEVIEVEQEEPEEVVAEPEEPAIEEAAPTPEPTPAMVETEPEPENDLDSVAPEKKKSKALPIVLIILLLAVGGFFLIKKKK